VAAR
jgi:hypothetical protein